MSLFKDKIKGIAIGDIHWNAFDANKMYEELRFGVLGHIVGLDKLDLVVINGDYWDCRTFMTSEAAILGFQFMDELVNMAVSKGCKHFRVLKGTLSHDKNQLDIFSVFEKRRDIDFKILNNVYREELFPNYHVLYIPEEYMDDVENFYAPYLSKEYNMVFGHGLFSDAIPVIKDQSSEVMIRKAPVFDIEAFNVTGHIIFSHVHKHMCIKNKAYYTSSFSRWVHGEEDDKGFIEFEYDTKTKQSNINFIVNTLALSYITKDFDLILNHMKAEEIIKMIEEIKVRENIDYLRVIFKVNVNDKDSVANWAIVKEYFGRNKYIKIVMNKFSKLQNLNIDNHQEFESIDEEIEAEVKKYWYLFDKSVDYIDKVVQYMSEIGMKLDRQKLENMLSKGEMDILKELTELKVGNM